MIYDDIMDELKDRGVYKYETYAPYFIASFAVHQFNLMNQKRKIYWVGKDVPNNRLHILFVSPAGYMKSYFIKTMAGAEFSVFRGSGTKIGYMQESTTAGFTGTSATVGGEKRRYIGVAEEYKDGIALVDEFAGITAAMQSQGNSQMESQLLSALDSGRIVKRLANENIDYITSVTVWAGVQPVRMDVSGGLGRRLCYLLCIPTKKDNEEIMKAMHRARGMKPDSTEMKKLWGRQKQFISDLHGVESVTYSDDVLDSYLKMGIYSYETTFFDNLLLGYHIAKYGVEKHIEISTGDKELHGLIKQQKEWRKRINQGVDYIQIVNIISMAGGIVDVNTIYEEAVMVGLNISQVSKILTEMVMNGIVMRKGNKVEMMKR